MSSGYIGPEPPPGLRKSPEKDVTQAEQQDDESTNQQIGPALPPHLLKSKLINSAESRNRASSSKGSATIGPVLPAHLQLSADKADEAEPGSSSSDSDSSDGDAQIGPSIDLQGGEYDVRKEFAEREERAKNSKFAAPKRESWMTELPSDRTGVKIGLGARMFTKRDGEDIVLDDSWTATPGQDEQRPKSNEQAAKDQLGLMQRKRDAEIDEQLAEFNAAKRSKPLIDMVKDGRERKVRKKERKEKKQKRKDKKHEKGKKKKKKKDKDKDKSDYEKPAGRKSFNWEEEMKVSMVDTSRAKSMLDKTLLQSRFASSKSQKYL